MRRLGALLTLVIVLLIAMAAPAAAAPPEHATRAADDTTTTEHGTAQDQSGSGMNRQGAPSEHPGKGWKDPGQDQGSPANVADPDCTGNRRNPQAANIGSCDDADGAADKPGGPGGFDADKDWNNGCGNDTDFEDDNNGQCRGPNPTPTAVVRPKKVTTKVTKPPPKPTPTVTTKPPPKPRPTVTPKPTTDDGPRRSRPPRSPSPPPSGDVDIGRPVAGPPSPPSIAPPATPPVSDQITRPLPITGSPHTADLAAIGLALITVGTLMIRTERRT